MYHEIQAEDETHSKKSASTGSSSAIKSRSRVKSMSKHDQFIRLTHFLFAIKSGLGVKSGWRLDILFTLVLLFIVLETDFLLYVLSPAWISWYIFSTLFTTFRPIKSTLYSVFYIFNIIHFEETAILAAVRAVVTSLLHPSRLHKHTYHMIVLVLNIYLDYIHTG